ncbi:hypothetical protein ABEF89_01785 [Acinetobacter thermotolerans]|uniref:hypothetical protein n=1 Tax=Acinetobacter thermotolerans TaxID=3151487 RepID=UPI00325BFE3D
MHFYLKLLIAILFVIALFIPGINGGFILDDIFNIEINHVLYVNQLNIDNLLYAALSFHDGNGERALPMLSFALDYWRAGDMDPSTFKTTNIMIHTITTFIIALFIKKLLILAKWTPQAAIRGALIVALIWAIHPLQVSAVLYIVQRMQTMATLFIVLSLWSYLLMRQNQFAGRRGRLYGILVILFWLMALACKEDAVLLPVYTLLLELVFLRFKAGQEVVARGLKQCYSLIIVLATLAFVFIFIPKYGCLGDVCGRRDFNSIERILTQGRVLVMYLGQILMPIPSNLPFIYDNYVVSRSLWQPWTTLISWLFIIGLISWAWYWRNIRPLFAFGVLFFFAGHIISSNVVLLELVFEHRNHLPLLGMVLALVDLVLYAGQRLNFGYRFLITLCIVICMALSTSTLYRTYIWGDGVRLGRALTTAAPDSVRAWAEYSSIYNDLYKETKNKNYLVDGVKVSEESLKHVKSSIMVGNMLMYKTILGTINENDWKLYYAILKQDSNQLHRQSSVSFLFDNYLRGYDIKEEKLIGAIESIESQGYDAGYLEVANTVFNTKRRERAILFYKKYIEVAEVNDPGIDKLFNSLNSDGYEHWVVELKEIINSRAKAPK